ncbi:MAG: hypothetical protein A3G34_00640 [Candidatus Lindowbacteria bacterium RIFCSPLOWO2_12_FULL_62_27]|nr:MAG: hypothetical protein A3G34_00640 [Candidatus Lindowbacteria bacterium RIFCSPLOWO2_12_FULL_62_27]OGH58181.1 MAG: hypothetical protein A3I06_00910 [Candidatus Lindowbacteria bacterium RIFCSPLOWO2_02_FULL_62_12]
MPLKRKFETTTTKRVPFSKHPGYTLEVHDLGGFLSNVQYALEFEKERVPVSAKFMTVGRGEMNHIDIRDENGQISRVHAKIECKDGAFTITDMGSTNGTYLNGNIIEKRKAFHLNAGDTIVFGKCAMARFIRLEPPAADPDADARDILPDTISRASG